MGLFDLPAPLFDIIDSGLALALPPLLRLVMWGILAGWLTMTAYRLFSNQEKIGALGAAQKKQQRDIAEFDGEFAELLPLIRGTFALGFRQLGLTLGPALLATLPAVFIIIWVAGAFGYQTPLAGDEVSLRIEPAGSAIQWSPAIQARIAEDGWVASWPPDGQTLTISDAHQAILVLPLEHNIRVIHKKRWWNLLVANPLGYLPAEGQTDSVNIDLPEAVFIAQGPGWMRGWMFSFFIAFLLSSLVFKRLLRLI
jgi:hypothetical protein